MSNEETDAIKRREARRARTENAVIDKGVENAVEDAAEKAVAAREADDARIAADKKAADEAYAKAAEEARAASDIAANAANKKVEEARAAADEAAKAASPIITGNPLPTSDPPVPPEEARPLSDKTKAEQKAGASKIGKKR